MRTIIGLPVLLVSFGLALPAMAQQDFSPNGIRAGAPAAPKTVYKSNPPPVAVPGARARTDSVAPAERQASDMPPTEALFDAINRGDIVTARDAVSRGADLDGTNLLGVTPLELSVDLGRNDISFLLLSLRGASGSQRSAGPQSAQAEGAPLTPAQKRKAQAEARADAAAETRAQTVSARPRTVAAPAPAKQGAALFAGNGGAAVPSAGFLGFDPHK